MEGLIRDRLAYCENCNTMRAFFEGSTCGQYFTSIGGDCKGNKWCECSLVIQPTTPTPIAGQEISVNFITGNLGQEVGPRDIGLRHRIDPIGGSVDWGDRTPPSKLAPENHILTHVYQTPGDYTISAEMHGAFKWNDPAQGASCSYFCKTAPSSLTVKIFGKKI